MIYLQTILQEWHRIIKTIIQVLSGSLLLAVSAQLAIPFYPVPFTLQTITVSFLAYILGKRLATAAVALYLLEGFCGLPVFANFSCGPTILLGSYSSGYLWGFLISAYCAGMLYERFLSKETSHLLCIGLISELLIFACGYLYLSCLTDFHTAWTLGVAPFLISTLLKNVLLAHIIRKL